MGRSLGVDLVSLKTCSFNCAYCQLGETTNLTTERKAYVPVEAVLAELDRWLASDGSADIITLSGSGEPTLSSDIRTVVVWLKQHTSIPVAVLTNGSLLWQAEVRESLLQADLLIPSLDAATELGFQRVNRPAPRLALELILAGLEKTRREFRGRFWLEVMLVSGLNDTETELDALRGAITLIRPDCVQLNTVVRPPACPGVVRVSEPRLRQAAARLGPGAEIIAPLSESQAARCLGSVSVDDVRRLVQRRPCRLADLTTGLASHPNEVLKYVQLLLDQQDIESRQQNGETYYLWRSAGSPQTGGDDPGL